MLMPSIFGENLFDDDWMNFPFNDEFWGKKNPLYGKHAQNMMKTDIRETDGSYELDVDLPGFKKDEIKVQLCYLILTALWLRISFFPMRFTGWNFIMQMV